MNRDLEFNEWSTYVAGSRRKNSTASNICFLIWLKCISFSYDWRRRVCVSENMCTFIDRSLISSKCYCFCFKIVSFFAVELRRHRATDLFVMDWSKNQYQSLFWALHTVFLLCILLFFFLLLFTSLSIVYSWIWFNCYYPLCICVLHSMLLLNVHRVRIDSMWLSFFDRCNSVE